MAATYYIILTDVGAAKIAASQSGGAAVSLATIRVGDSNGTYYEPTSAQTALVNQVWSGAITSLTQDALDPTTYTAEAVIPVTSGGFVIREAGLFDTAGDLIAVGKYPLLQKTVVADGAGEDVAIRFLIKVSPTANITVTIDPYTVYATVSYVDGVMATHLAAVDPHPQYKPIVPKISLSNVYTLKAATHVCGDAIAIDANNALTVYATTANIYAVITNVVAGVGTLNGELLIEATTATNISIAKSGTNYVMFWNNAGTTKACVLTVSGTVITAGTVATVSASAHASSQAVVTLLTSTSGVMNFTAVTTAYPMAVGFTISGTTLTIGTPTQITATATGVILQYAHSIEPIDATHALLGFRTTNSSVVVITLTGTSVAFGSILSLGASNGAQIAICTSTYAVIQLQTGTPSTLSSALNASISISGTTLAITNANAGITMTSGFVIPINSETAVCYSDGVCVPCLSNSYGISQSHPMVPTSVNGTSNVAVNGGYYLSNSYLVLPGKHATTGYSAISIMKVI